MSDRVLARYRRFFRLHGWLARHVHPAGLMLETAARLGRYWHPGQPAAQFPVPGPLGQWQCKQPGAWARHRSRVCVGTALLYCFERFPDMLSLEWDDPDGALETARTHGGLVLTYHHPFAYHFAALVGCAGVGVEVVALSPEESPLYPLFEQVGARAWFDESERHFGGGRWVFLRAGQAGGGNTVLRRALQALRSGRAVISVHDFSNFFAHSESVRVHFLGRDVLAPLGLIGPALARGLPVCVGHAQWLGGRRFKISLASLNDNGREACTQQVLMARYFARLEALVQSEPEFWEGWGLL